MTILQIISFYILKKVFKYLLTRKETKTNGNCLISMTKGQSWDFDPVLIVFFLTLYREIRIWESS